MSNDPPASFLQVRQNYRHELSYPAKSLFSKMKNRVLLSYVCTMVETAQTSSSALRVSALPPSRVWTWLTAVLSPRLSIDIARTFFMLERKTKEMERESCTIHPNLLRWRHTCLQQTWFPVGRPGPRHCGRRFWFLTGDTCM